MRGKVYVTYGFIPAVVTALMLAGAQTSVGQEKGKMRADKEMMSMERAVPKEKAEAMAEAGAAGAMATVDIGPQIGVLFVPPDGKLKVHQSTFDELAIALAPIEKSGGFPIHVEFDICFIGCVHVKQKLCDSTYTARLENLRFTVLPSVVNITGKVGGNFHCVATVGLNSPLNATANVTYNSTQRRIEVQNNPTSIPVCIQFPDWVPFVGGDSICLPYRVNVGQTLNYNIPIRTTSFYFESAQGPTSIRLTPQNLSFWRSTGFINLEGDVVLW